MVPGDDGGPDHPVVHGGSRIGVAAVAAVASYEHASAVVRAHGEAGWTARLVPLTVDGLIYASSMVMLDSARRKVAGVRRWRGGCSAWASPRRWRPMWRTAWATEQPVPSWRLGQRWRWSGRMNS